MKFGELRFTYQFFKDSLAVSGIVGIAAGIGSWIFSKINEHNSNKAHPLISHRSLKM